MFAHVVRDVPHQVLAEVQSPEDCRARGLDYTSSLTDNMLCVRYTEAGQNLCYMIAGSSLVCRQNDSWWQHGFASWGASGCTSATRPEIHSNVVKYLPWIEQNTGGQFLRRICYRTNFKCSTDHAKRSFYRSANAIFGRVGRITSEAITLQLINTKCIPILLYGLEACPLLMPDLSSLDFVVNRLFIKLFKTSNTDVVKCCQNHFGFDLPSVSWPKRVKKFESKFHACKSAV